MITKITFHLNNRSEGIELSPERVLCNNIIFAGEFNPHNVRLFVIGNQFGAMGAVWADCEQDAIDELIDADLAGGILVDETDAGDNEDISRGGNASEPYDSEYLWMAEVDLRPDRDFKTLMRFAEARGNNSDTLDF